MQRNSGGPAATLALDILPAAVFAASISFAVATAFALPKLSAGPAAAGIGGFVIVLLALGRIVSITPAYGLPAFEPADPGFVATDEIETLVRALSDSPQDPDMLLPEDVAPAGQADELLLDETMRASPDELILEEVLVSTGPDSRVVPLFREDRSPTAGELHQRIEDHLQRTSRALPDATAELREALAELRQSLR